MNKLIISGRLVRDPQCYHTKNNSWVVRFTLASYKSKDKTNFINLVAFGKTAEILMQNGYKGRMILVEGEATSSSYTKNGKKVYAQDLVAYKVEFIAEEKTKKKEDKIQKAITKTEQLFDYDVGLPFD